MLRKWVMRPTSVSMMLNAVFFSGPSRPSMIATCIAHFSCTMETRRELLGARERTDPCLRRHSPGSLGRCRFVGDAHVWRRFVRKLSTGSPQRGGAREDASSQPDDANAGARAQTVWCALDQAAMDAPDGSRLHMPRPIRAGELDASRLLSGGASAGAPGGSDPSAVFGAARRRKLSQVSRTSRRTIAEDRERAPPPYSNDERLMLNDRRYHTSTMMTDSPSKRSTASRHTQLGALTASNLHMHETAKASSKRSHLGVETRKRAQSPGAASVSSSIISAATLPQTPSFAAAALALQKERSRGAGKTEHTSMIKRFLRHAERTGRSRRSTTLAVVSVVVLLKWTVGLGGYSGYGTAPLFGDLEAQRHWMGLTLHREVGEWYFYDLECELAFLLVATELTAVEQTGDSTTRH